MKRVDKKITTSIRHAFHGLVYAYNKEQSFRLEVWAGFVLIVIGYIARPLNGYEFLFLLFSYLLVLALELINTALERSLERLHPEEHELIGRSKDLASAAVLVGVVFSGIVICTILVSRFIL